MLDRIQDWFKKQQERYEEWKREQDRRHQQWQKKHEKAIPPGLGKLVEMYPLIKFMDYYNPLLIDPEEEEDLNRDSETRDYIRKTQEELLEKLRQNGIDSRDGKGGRAIRPATPEEQKEYEKKTTEQSEIWKIQNDVNIVSSFGGIPETKVFHLKQRGVKLGKKVFLAASNVIDPYFPELIHIGDDTILGLGASIFCHEFVEGKLYVGEVNVGKECLVGFGSIVLPGTTMEDRSILTPGFLMSDLEEKTMAKGLDGSIRIKAEESSKLPKRQVEKLGFTLHDYMDKLVFPKEKPLKTAFTNMYIEWQKSNLVSERFRNRILRLAGITIGNNVRIAENVHFDTFYPEKIKIGNGVVIKKNATIITHEGTVHDFRSGPVEIGDNVIIESGAKILPGVRIGKNSAIYPYSFVDHDIPPDTKFKS